MHMTRDGRLCDVEIFRKALGGGVVADSEVPEAFEILRRCGFEIHEMPPYRWAQLPAGLSTDREKAMATRAALAARAHGLVVDLDPQLEDPDTLRSTSTAAEQQLPPPGPEAAASRHRR